MAITALDSGIKTRYLVRVMRRGKLYSRTFTSKRAAQKYERELKSVLGPPRSQKGKPKPVPTPNTGVKRIVRRTFQRSGRNPVDVYTVYWRTPNGAPRYSNISIDHWGEKKAFALAKKKKKEMDRQQML
jgi:hypothetical protein